MVTTFRKLLRDESGATAIEYGLIAALIAVALIVGLQSLGNGINDQFNEITEALTGSGAGG